MLVRCHITSVAIFALHALASRFSIEGAVGEADAVEGLQAASAQDLRSLAFAEIENLVKRSWWRAATAAVTSAHRFRIDFTAPVRRAVGEVKQEADSLLRWLDPRYAHPEPTQMAIRWAQNETAIMIAARFAPKWDAPGATISVFTSAGGRGHVDKDRTAEQVRKLLQVDVQRDSVQAQIITEAQNVRKRYTLDIALFDEVVPERSNWTVDFIRAQGSMQMSKGAQIPELWVLLRKRWPGAHWSRLLAGDSNNLTLLEKAPGLPRKRAEAAVLTATAPTCRASAQMYCPSSDVCVPDCSTCEAAPIANPEAARCYGKPVEAMLKAVFVDKDLRPDLIGGTLRWLHNISASQAQAFNIYWVSGSGERLHRTPAWTVPVLADPRPALEVLYGTELPKGATSMQVCAANVAGESVFAIASIVDAVRPFAPRLASGTFIDQDTRRGYLSGVAVVDRPGNEANVNAYELHWGKSAEKSNDTIRLLWPKVRRRAGLVRSMRTPGADPLRLEVQRGTRVPPGATSLLLVAEGSGGALSKYVSFPLVDAAPPNVRPRALRISPDLNSAPGVVSFKVSVEAGSCSKNAQAQRPDNRGGKGRQRDQPVVRGCDMGTAFVIYWAGPSGQRIRPAVATVEKTSPHVELQDVHVPAGVKALMAVARNKHASAPNSDAVFAVFDDDRSEVFDAWKGAVALAAEMGGAPRLSVWHPMEGSVRSSDVAQRLRGGGSITAVALSESGTLAVCGQEDGGVAVLDLAADDLTLRISGRGAVTALSFDSVGMRLVRGARSGDLDVWDLKAGVRQTELTGHGAEITAIQTNWSAGQVLTASRDGYIRMWELGADISLKVFGNGGDTAFSDVSVDWHNGRVFAASSDETLHMYALSGPGGSEPVLKLDGHTDGVRHLSVDWQSMSALSVSEDNVAKLWNITSREATLTLRHNDNIHDAIRAISVSWASMTAMVVFETGNIVLWDLTQEDGGRRIAPKLNPLGHTTRLVAVTPML